MAQQTINVGAAPNDGTGTPLRTAFQYTNSNFSELYTAVGPSGNNIVVPGTATITGDLTVDTSTLKVDSANNRVGIGTASPATILDIQSAGGVFARIQNTASSADAYLLVKNTVGEGFFGINATGPYIYTAGSLPITFTTATSERYRIASDGVATWSNVGGVAGTAMTLNANGLGIGVNPVTSHNLSSAGPIAISGTNSGTRTSYISNSGSCSIYYTDGGGSGFFADFGNLIIQPRTSAARNVVIATSSAAGTPVERLIVDPNGNVGIGVTPSAWGGSYKALQLQSVARNIAATGAGLGDFTIAFNAIYDSTDSRWEYAGTGDKAGRYSQTGSGNHRWFVSNTAGTAGNEITDFASPAMTLDASGNLLVGVASSSNRLDIQKSTDCAVLVKSTGANTNIAMDYVSNYGNHTIRKSGTAVWDFGVINDSSATPAFKFSNGPSAVGVQLVHGATAWTALSDETVKDIIEPITNAITKVGSLRSVIGKFKTDDASKRRSFLIAQDVFAVLPEAVDVVGEKNELGVRYSDVIPLLVAAIKELSAEVNALKNA